jgi:preprotein translocase subunit SecE
VSESSSVAEQEVRIGYLAGTVQELRKVIWPTREELLRMTAVVVFTVAAVAAFIGVIDSFLTYISKPLYGS